MAQFRLFSVARIEDGTCETCKQTAEGTLLEWHEQSVLGDPSVQLEEHSKFVCFKCLPKTLKDLNGFAVAAGALRFFQSEGGQLDRQPPA